MKGPALVSYCTAFFAFLFALPLYAQDQSKGDVVYLLGAEVAGQFEKDGILYQRVVGSARFLHNNTYILCDTAIWNRQSNIIDAKGHIQIIQKQTKLTGETIHYIGDINLAQIRGQVVELSDKEGNRLRTQYLDFNTKDSIGTFSNGGSMVDSKGNILESLNGNYFSKEKRFYFERMVEMNTDTVKIKSDVMEYKTDIKRVNFFGNVHAWHSKGYLSAQKGRYDREVEYFHFEKEVYVKTEKQEVWADTLEYDKNKGSGKLFRNIQILDTTQSLILMADEGYFENKPQTAMLTKQPVIAIYSYEEGVRDTLFARADTIQLYTHPKYAVDSNEVAAATSRFNYLHPKAAAKDSAALAGADVKKQGKPPLDVNAQTLKKPAPEKTSPPPVQKTTRRSKKRQQVEEPKAPDSVTVQRPVAASIAKDTVVKAVPDSIRQLHLPLKDTLLNKTLKDSVSIIKDTTSIRFLYAFRNVKAYRSDGQSICDSLAYTSLDSTARLYGGPVIWSEKNQFLADSIQFYFQNNTLSRADLFSSAYVIAQEDSLLYHQVKSKNMIGYFKDKDLYRFDAIGSVEALFFIPEDSVITSMKQVETKYMKVLLEKRKIQDLFYYSEAKINYLPMLGLESSKQKLHQFNWHDQERPKSRNDITSRVIRPSAAAYLQRVQQPMYLFTGRFFPEHLPSGIQKTKSIDTLQRSTPAADSLNKPINPRSLISDSLVLQISRFGKSLQQDPHVRDSLLKIALTQKTVPITVIDSLPKTAVPQVQTQVEEPMPPAPLTKKELRIQRRAQKKALAAQRKEERLSRKKAKAQAKAEAKALKQKK